MRLSDRPSGCTRVIWVRNGRSTDSDRQCFQDPSDDSVLTGWGWQSARYTGQALRGIDFDAVYTSPLQRAQQTAQAIVDELRLRQPTCPAPEVCTDLLDIDLHHWAGLTYRAVRQNWAAAYRHWKTRPETFSLLAPSEGKACEHSGLAELGIGTEQIEPAAAGSIRYPVLELYTQTKAFWRKIAAGHRQHTILAIAHSGSITAALSTSMGLPPSHYHRLQQSHCGISVVDVDEQGRALPEAFKAMNLTGHLGEIYPQLNAGKQGSRIVLIPAESDWFGGLRLWVNALDSYDCWIDDSNAAYNCALQLERRTTIVMQRDASVWSTAALAFAGVPQTRTVIAIAASSWLQQMLTTWLELEPESAMYWAIAANCATIVHFPSATQKPILQALNFAPMLEAIHV